jgi:preprotein translocase subunit SecG
MVFFIGLLTLLMVLDCIVLVFLVLIQLPKKEAGAGLAFGGAASDALFGAGSGNVLTKITKYAATIFMVGAVILSILQSRFHARHTGNFLSEIQRSGQTAPAAVPPMPTARPTPPAGAMVSTNLTARPPVEDTNLPAPPATATAPATPTSPAATNAAPVPAPK